MNVWNKKIEAESNSYNWLDKPKIISSLRKEKNDFIHIDLFSGCGGFSEGFHQAGFKTEVAIDIHPPSMETLLNNHKSTNGIVGDIKKVKENTINDLISNKKSIKVLTAGVPCQGFSLSNRKRHSEDKRNYLFKEFIRIAKFINPDAVILENVSGLASTKDGFFKKNISKAISDLGFDVSFSIINSADYGLPQTRRRVFFIGVRKGLKWLFPQKTHGINLKPYVTVKDAILGDLPKLKNKEEKTIYISKPTSDYQKYLRRENKVLTNHVSPNHPESTIKKILNTKPGFPMYPKFKQRIRLDASSLSPTQVCGGIRPQFQFGHPNQPRGLTIRERARIQGFPDSYFFSGGMVQGRVQTGNAVPVLVAKQLAKQLLDLINGKKIIGIPEKKMQLDLFK